MQSRHDYFIRDLSKLHKIFVELAVKLHRIEGKQEEGTRDLAWEKDMRSINRFLLTIRRIANDPRLVHLSETKEDFAAICQHYLVKKDQVNRDKVNAFYQKYIDKAGLEFNEVMTEFKAKFSPRETHSFLKLNHHDGPKKNADLSPSPTKRF